MEVFGQSAGFEELIFGGNILDTIIKYLGGIKAPQSASPHPVLLTVFPSFNLEV